MFLQVCRGFVWFCIVFVCSKKIEDYESSIKTALIHYNNVIETSKIIPNEDSVDPKSPQEKKVLVWLSKSKIINGFKKNVEIIPQFEIGKYLRSLNPDYKHPNFKVDFLLIFTRKKLTYQIILEYDGFEFHFHKTDNPSEINKDNWEFYLTESDVEREKILESFGLKMIRLNRFNVGKDPVATLDKLLYDRLKDLLGSDEPHDLINEIKNQTNEIEKGLNEGETKLCKKCQRYLPITMFVDRKTKSGYGRFCRSCKNYSEKN